MERISHKKVVGGLLNCTRNSLSLCSRASWSYTLSLPLGKFNYGQFQLRFDDRAFSGKNSQFLPKRVSLSDDQHGFNTALDHVRNAREIYNLSRLGLPLGTIVLCIAQNCNYQYDPTQQSILTSINAQFKDPVRRYLLPPY